MQAAPSEAELSMIELWQTPRVAACQSRQHTSGYLLEQSLPAKGVNEKAGAIACRLSESDYNCLRSAHNTAVLTVCHKVASKEISVKQKDC